MTGGCIDLPHQNGGVCGRLANAFGCDYGAAQLWSLGQRREHTEKVGGGASELLPFGLCRLTRVGMLQSGLAPILETVHRGSASLAWPLVVE